MTLKAVHDTIDEIPEQYRELYSEKSGKFELTGVVGVKTQADIDRLQTSLHRAQDDNKELKAKFSVWGDMDHADVTAQLDRIPELEAASKGALDDAKVEEIVARRVEGTIKTQRAPLERQIADLTKQNETLTATNETLVGEKRQRQIHDAVRKVLVDKKVIGEAHEDALMIAERVFEIREDDGEVVTRDQVGCTPGLSPDMWLAEMQPKRPHWWPTSQGGGASPGAGSGSGGVDNPWSAESWNLTRQGQILNSQGRAKADQMAKLAGTTVGGRPPAAKKAA